LVDLAEESVDSATTSQIRFHKKIVKVARPDASQRPNPLTEVGQTPWNIDFAAGIVDLDCDQSLNDLLFVDPAPDLELMFV
jgi:hypothetical protein